MSKRFELTRDSHNRLCTEIAEGMTVGVKLLAEGSKRRIEKGVHGYAVLDLTTPLGLFRIRGIEIMWSEKNERFFLRWRQFGTGNVRNGRPEYLDVVGPHSPESRAKVEDQIVAVFKQVLADATKGTIGRLAGPELEALKVALEEQTKEAEELAATPA